MKETVLDVLMYLYTHCKEEKQVLLNNHKLLKTELFSAGFSGYDINHTFLQLEHILPSAEKNEMTLCTLDTMRIYLPEESEKLDIECQGFLLFLEQMSILDYEQRELIVERALILDGEDFSLEQLKWVILTVLFNQPDQDEFLAWGDEVMFQDITGYLH